MIGRKYWLIIIGTFILSAGLGIGCGNEGDSRSVSQDAATSDTPPNPVSNIPRVSIIQPSPYLRIHGDMIVSIQATDDKGIRHVYVLMDGVVVALFNQEPYTTVIRAGILPAADKTYTFQAVAFDFEGNAGIAEIEIRLDFGTNMKNVIVVDSDADPFGFGGQPGAVFRINPETGTVCTLASHPWFKDPSGVVEIPPGNPFSGALVVSDRTALMGGAGGGSGALFRVRKESVNNVEVLAASNLFQMPLGMDVTPNSVFVSDALAAAVYSVNPVTGAVTTELANTGLLVNPTAVTLDPSGDLWIADVTANKTIAVSHGSVWRYHRDTGILDNPPLAESLNFRTPFGVEPDGAGKLILIDTGSFSGGIPAKIFRLDPTDLIPTSGIELLFQGGILRSPSGFVRISATDYLIADRNADPLGGSTRGAVLRFNSATGAVTFEYTSNLFSLPYDVTLGD